MHNSSSSLANFSDLIMESTKPEIDYEFLPMLRVYKDGHVERLMETDFVPAVSNDPITGVSSKDITIVQEPNNNINISARLYLPKLTTTTTTQKFPLLVYFHGGAFCVSSPFTFKYHNCINALVAEANVVVVSVNYRKAPEHLIPAAYEDSWAALKWISSHSSNNGGAGSTGDSEFGLNVEILGIALIHPYFWGSDPIGSEFLNPASAAADRLWPFICPSNPDNDDPRVNPVVAGGPSLVGLGIQRPHHRSFIKRHNILKESNNNNINISARLYLPKLTNTTTTQKFPLLVYFHGVGFCISSPFTSKYHNYVNALVAEANVVAVSVNYRKAPEHPIPAAYEDSWAALKWVASHSGNNGDRYWVYYNALSKCGWMGVVEIFETDCENHGFHLYDFPSHLPSQKAKDLIRRLAAFFNRDMPPLP
ncbi:hypothetical protein Dsin_003319 [Dipteronia sinensis]|uniref:Alpha/beta hydrolase fold-3 domain-containing protein n=1 Tax=Dipteronia sinensis TaxID=43782 RepID=A0AAE0B8Q7_9ROSI|nr:hypothetical protein Dsin_003319 [Dipteronia sinensis]